MSCAARAAGGTGSVQPRRLAKASEQVPDRMRMEQDASQASLAGRVILGGAKPLRDPTDGQGISGEGALDSTGHQALNLRSAQALVPSCSVSLVASSAGNNLLMLPRMQTKMY